MLTTSSIMSKSSRLGPGVLCHVEAIDRIRQTPYVSTYTVQLQSILSLSISVSYPRPYKLPLPKIYGPPAQLD